jgi:hypothetical protein
MFERLKYKRIAREYFRPHESDAVSLEDFLKVLRGEVFNPRRVENPQTACDYAFMIVGVNENSPINSWAGREWGVNSYGIAQGQSSWYGKFTAEGSSRLVIPPKTEVDFHYKSRSPLGVKIYIAEFEVEPWRFGGFMQLDKDLNYRTLVSNLTTKEVAGAIRQTYQDQRNVRFDLLDRLR